VAIIDRIKFDGPPGILVWKWPSDQLTLGTQLIVHESQEAVFFKGGKALDVFGPGTHTLSTGNLPLLRKLINLPFGGKTPFAAEVWFVNRTVALEQTWGTPSPIMLRDPTYGVTIPIRGYGQFGVQVKDSQTFLVHIVGASEGALAADVATKMLDAPIATCVQQGLGDYMVKEKISALELPAHTLAITSHVMELLLTNYETMGLDLVNFTMESINFDKNDESVKKLREMLDEAARLNVVGDAFRQNQDFYRAERQFDVMDKAAGSDGVAGSLMGATMGVGMGFGVAGPAGAVAQDAMQPQKETPIACPKCGAQNKVGAKFCGECGDKLETGMKRCPNCNTENVATAKFCNGCGESFAGQKCSECGADIPAGGKFCMECGHKNG